MEIIILPKNLSRENHFCVIISNTPTVNYGLHNAEFVCEFGKLFSAAVNYTEFDSDLMNQRQLFSQRRKIFFVFSNFAGKFDDKGFALKSLDIRKCFA